MTESAWRLLPFSQQPADEQMALSEAMLASVQTPALRWRQIVPEALVLGHGQRLESVDWQACQAAGCGVFRRASGGTAVLSGPDLLGLDLVLPAVHPLALADVMRSYAWLGEALAGGLRSLGVDATAVSPMEARAQSAAMAADSPLRLACYATLSPYEIAAGGRKLVGLAQARRRSGVLFQAGVVLRWRPQRLAALLAVPAPTRTELAAALHTRAVGLDELVAPFEIEALIRRLNQAIARATGEPQALSAWSNAELAAAAAARPSYTAMVARPS